MNSERKQTVRINSIDTLKGLMILSIVLYHLPEWLHGFPNILSFAYKWGGDYGNAFFFMISGFTMCLAYSDRVQDMDLKEFIKQRVLKIYALYLISDAVQMIFEIITRGISVINIRDIVLNLTMTTSGWVENIYPYNIAAWFFSALLLDYILFFIASKYGKEKKYYIYVILVITGMVIQKMNLQVPFLYYHNGEAYAPFFIGCTLSKVWTDCKYRIRLYLPFLLLTICLIGLSMINGLDVAAGLWKYAWYFAVCPFLILSAIDIKFINSFLSMKPLVVIIGAISTYVFFWHGPFMNYFVFLKIKGMLGLDTNGFILFYIPALMLFCHIYRIVEHGVKHGLLQKYRSQIVE